MNALCNHCHADIPRSAGKSGLDGELLCSECHRAELLDLFRSADMDVEEVKTLRRRIEDCLRKNPGWLLHVAAWMASEGAIRFEDLI